MDRAQWEDKIRAYARGLDRDAVEAIAGRLIVADESGEPSSIWHEVWLWGRERWPYPPCPICGGPAGRGGVHELCRARQAHGLPTPALDARPECACAKCQR